METPYDRLTYPGTVYPFAHISRIAVAAALYGVTTPDLKTCRVLELGCNRGLHLINMALEYPDAQFVGIDIAETAIARASELAEALRLKNISFRTMDVLHLSGRPGECDYLIAHGLYSWSSDAVREKILELCGHVLAPTGVAFLSYNTSPGWYFRRIVGEIIGYHTTSITDPTEKLQAGAELMGAIIRSLGADHPHGAALRAETELLMGKNPVIAEIDDLSADTTSVHFTGLIRKARTFGLQYLCETDLQRVAEEHTPAEAREFLSTVADPVAREQYLDFFLLPRLRHTLLCREGIGVLRDGWTERIREMWIGAPLEVTETVEIVNENHARFVAQNGSVITVAQPMVKAVLAVLSETWPGRISYTELMRRAAARLTTAEVDGEALALRTLEKLLSSGLLEVALADYAYAATPGEKPLASSLARLQASNSSEVVSLRHTIVDFSQEPLSLAILRLLDGTKSRADILAALRLAGHEVSSELLETNLKRMVATSLLMA